MLPSVTSPSGGRARLSISPMGRCRNRSMTWAPMRFSIAAASFGPTPGSTVVAANRPKISVGRLGCMGAWSGRWSVKTTRNGPSRQNRHGCAQGLNRTRQVAATCCPRDQQMLCFSGCATHIAGLAMPNSFDSLRRTSALACHERFRMNQPPADRDTRLRRLVYQSSYTGMKETDLLLGRFASSISTG